MKPRIKKFIYQLWVCTGRGLCNYGRTPKEAYENWAALIEEWHVTRLQGIQDK